PSRSSGGSTRISLPRTRRCCPLFFTSRRPPCSTLFPYTTLFRSAHVFEGKIYIYPSHDVETDVAQDDLGSHFDMKDYHVYSMETDRKSTRLNSSHVKISYAVFCLKKKTGCGSSPRRPAAPPPPPR